jgi:serine/threonine protein phosphatase PrpC
MQLEIDEMIEDGRYSGCTCTSVLIFGNKLYVANLGDLRIVLVKEKE